LNRSALAALFVLCLLTAPASAQEGPPYDADAVVVIVKKSNDFRGLCLSGPGNMRKVVTETVIDLAQKGQIKGDPRSVGEEAGAKLGQQCRSS